MSKKKKSKKPSSTIAQNKKAWHEYFLEDRFEAGIVLEGWEVKSLRAGHGQLTEAYVEVRDGEVFLVGARITPLLSASSHITPDPQRRKKLLLNKKEISKLIGAVERKGYTLAPIAMYWKNGRVKLEIALAKGKQAHDKRASIKQREVDRELRRALKNR